MPKYKKNYKKGKGKGKMQKYNAKPKESMLYNPSLGGTPFPSKYFTKMTATLLGHIKVASPTPPAETLILPIKLNSVYRPFQYVVPGADLVFAMGTPSGYQMAGFPTLFGVNVYQRFRVLGSRINIDVLPDRELDNITTTVTPSNRNDTPVSLTEASEQKYTKMGIFANGRPAVITGLAGKQYPKANSLNHYLTPSRFLGVPKKALDYDLSGTYTGTYSSDPAGLQFWMVNMGPTDQLALSGQVGFRVTVVYYVECYDFTHATN